MPNNYQWKPQTILNKDGIIVGCTQNQEWLLPWWWMKLNLYNNYPITFVDFGDMSKKAINWCKQRGEVVALNFLDFSLTPKEKINSILVSIWEASHTQVWQVRSAWFKKPFALLQSPYARTLW